MLFALYIGVKLGQKSESTVSSDNNNNDIEQIQFQEVEEEESDDSEDLMNNKYLNYLLLPLTVMFDITMPSKMSSVMKFFMSIGWLSTLSYFSVNAITDMSKLFNAQIQSIPFIVNEVIVNTRL